MTPEAIPGVGFVMEYGDGTFQDEDQHRLLRLQYRYHRRFPTAPPSVVLKVVVHILSRRPHEKGR